MVLALHSMDMENNMETLLYYFLLPTLGLLTVVLVVLYIKMFIDEFGEL